MKEKIRELVLKYDTTMRHNLRSYAKLEDSKDISKIEKAQLRKVSKIEDRVYSTVISDLQNILYSWPTPNSGNSLSNFNASQAKEIAMSKSNEINEVLSKIKLAAKNGSRYLKIHDSLKPETIDVLAEKGFMFEGNEMKIICW